MFDPLFALLLLASAIIPLALVTFAVARKYLPHGSARVMAFVLPIVALIGFFGAAVVQSKLSSNFFCEAPLIRVAISFMGSALLVGLVGWLIWHSARWNRPI